MMENILSQLAVFLMSLYQPIYYLALFVASVFVVSGLSDLFFDIIYLGWNLRRFIIGRNWRPLTLERLDAREQQRIAIFIAAWKESDVIAQTLRNAVSTIRYKNYDIFVGTYPAVRALAKLEQQGENALLHLLHSKDRFARDAARTVLEQQGFLTQYDQELRNNGHKTHHQAFNFLDVLANEGNSTLAQEIVEIHQ